MNQPEIALLISTYQRPAHLRRALESVALQSGVDGLMEVVVTDDGSTDETASIVSEFARRVPFRVGFTTHEHGGFQLARCRNEGVRASTAPYLLFLDGDCILPRDHVRKHLDHRRPNTVMAGDCCRLDEEPSDRVTLDVIRSGAFTDWAPASELRRLRKADRSCAVLPVDSPSDEAEADRQQRRHLAARLRARERLRRELSGLGLRGRRSATSAAQSGHRHRLDPALDAHLSSLASQRGQHASQLERRR